MHGYESPMGTSNKQLELKQGLQTCLACIWSVCDQYNDYPAKHYRWLEQRDNQALERQLETLMED